MATKLTITDIALADLPRATPFQVLAMGADVYCQGLRAGATVTLVAKDGEMDVTLSQAVSIGPLANFINPNSVGMTAHYATKQNRDPLAMFDSLSALYPKDAKAVDPRTIYSCATIEALPYPMAPLPTAAV